jgi:hypothetical protein
MSMTHMAITPKENKQELAPAPEETTEDKGPTYPFGLCIRLTDEELRKLGIEDKPEVGDMLSFDAVAKVTHYMEHADGEGSKCCVELQITHLGVDDDDHDDKDDMEKYPRKNAMKRYENGDDDDGEE